MLYEVITFCGTDALARQSVVDRTAEERGMTAIDNWEYPPIVPGHASIGMEIVEDCPDVETVLVPVSVITSYSIHYTKLYESSPPTR